jgi:hypothetical protein
MPRPLPAQFTLIWTYSVAAVPESSSRLTIGIVRLRNCPPWSCSYVIGWSKNVICRSRPKALS